MTARRSGEDRTEPYIEELEDRFAKAALPALACSSWKLWGVRPANMPARRLAGAAALLASLRQPAALLALVESKTAAALSAPLCAPQATGYWLRHADTVGVASRLPPAFVGRSRALEIVANVVLPAAVVVGEPGDDRGRRWWEKLPRPASYGATRFIESALASDGVRVPVNARRASGLLALHRDWCTQGGCGRCPLSVHRSQSAVHSSEPDHRSGFADVAANVGPGDNRGLAPDL